jgi:hypothetical protein
MKNFGLALICLSLFSCGTTPKNEVARNVPQPQQDATQADFEARCFKDEKNLGRGILNAARTMCRKPESVISFGRANDKDYEQSEPVKDTTLLPNAGAGAVLYGTYESTTLPPEFTLDGVKIAVGNVDQPLLIDRAGTVRMTTFKGAYKSLNYVVATCSSRTSSYVPCQIF